MSASTAVHKASSIASNLCELLSHLDWNASGASRYEDWAFWIAAQQFVGIKPEYVREFLFQYRIREESMHQTLLKNQEFSLARFARALVFP